MNEDFDILKDQAKLKKHNLEYLKKFISNYFQEAYFLFSKKYEEFFQSELIDPESTVEKEKLILERFEVLKIQRSYPFNLPYRFHSSIKVENSNFRYSIEEILGNANRLIDEIYPTLDKRKDESVNFQFFVANLRNSAEKAFLQNLLKKNSIALNTAIFNCYSIQEFFELYLFKEWLSKIEKCKPHLSYIYKRLKGSGSYFENQDPGLIICTGKVFMNYWNSLNHPFKIEERSNSNISLHNDPGVAHKPQFDALLQDYINKNI